MIAALFDDGTRGATLSPCGLYRYDLWRRWADGPLMSWVMLNPSTGDADLDDRTLRRCIGFARRDGFAGITVRNLYAYRTPKPRILRQAMAAGVDVVGPDNNRWLERLAADRFGTRLIVAAWGATAGTARRVAEVEEIFRQRQLHRLVADVHSNAAGVAAPHPLYLDGDTTPITPYPTRSST